MLPHRVDIEYQDESRKAADCFLEIDPILRTDTGLAIEKGQENDARGERERNQNGKSPKPPFPALNLAHFERSKGVASRGSNCAVVGHPGRISIFRHHVSRAKLPR